jgi:type III secretory pathway component EscU
MIQKRVFLHENRMSKYDVKRDYKEMEGDPLVKSRRQALHGSLKESSADNDV